MDLQVQQIGRRLYLLRFETGISVLLLFAQGRNSVIVLALRLHSSYLLIVTCLGIVLFLL